MVYSRTTQGSVALYACNMGFFLYGNTTNVCLDNGQWEHPKPVCTGEYNKIIYIQVKKGFKINAKMKM